MVQITDIVKKLKAPSNYNRSISLGFIFVFLLSFLTTPVMALDQSPVPSCEANSAWSVDQILDYVQVNSSINVNDYSWVISRNITDPVQSNFVAVYYETDHEIAFGKAYDVDYVVQYNNYGDSHPSISGAFHDNGSVYSYNDNRTGNMGQEIIAGPDASPNPQRCYVQTSKVHYVANGDSNMYGLQAWDAMPIWNDEPIIDVYNAFFTATVIGKQATFKISAQPGGQPTDTTIETIMFKYEGVDDDFEIITSANIVPHCSESGCFYTAESQHTFTDFASYDTYMTVIDSKSVSATFSKTITTYNDENTRVVYGQLGDGDIENGEDCSKTQDMMSNIICVAKKQFHVGIINPSITAMKDLFQSFIVPDEPQCGFALVDITIASGETFPVSDLPDVICNQATTLRQAFPIASVLVNFSLAYLLLTLIIGVINKLFRHDDTDIIVGVK
jgi:hypothetical protein